LPAKLTSSTNIKVSESKVLKFNSNIYFNKQFILSNLTSNYAQITLPNTPRASRITKTGLKNLRIEDEVKFFTLKT